MYHGENNQEDFLVLAGECLLLVEGEERRLRAWDFFHCPAWTEHVLVGAGDGPCVFSPWARARGAAIFYPVAEVAQQHGASAVEGTDSPKEAYACRPTTARSRTGRATSRTCSEPGIAAVSGAS